MDRGVCWATVQKVRVLVAQLCLTLCDTMDCSPPGSSVHGILQARILGGHCLSLLQGIVLTQGSNPGLLRCGQILYQLSHKGSPKAFVVNQIWAAHSFLSLPEFCLQLFLFIHSYKASHLLRVPLTCSSHFHPQFIDSSVLSLGHTSSSISYMVYLKYHLLLEVSSSLQDSVRFLNLFQSLKHFICSPITFSCAFQCGLYC